MAKTKYDNTKWSVPSKRAKGYAEERKVKVHKWGQKKGKQLTDYEAGMRSGYLQCQNDHAGMYKYTKALSEGKSKAEATLSANKDENERQIAQLNEQISNLQSLNNQLQETNELNTRTINGLNAQIVSLNNQISELTLKHSISRTRHSSE